MRLIPAILIGLLSVLWAADFAEGGIYRRGRIEYIYNGDKPDLVDKLHRQVRQRLPEMGRAMGVKLERNLIIYLTQSREEFHHKTRGRVPHWAGGVAYPGQDRIIVKDPIFFGQGVTLGVLTAHEIAHILVHNAVGDVYLPRWLDEGLATVLANEHRAGELTVLNRAVLADRLIPLPRVDRVLSFSAGDAKLAYAVSGAATRWFVDRFEWQAVRDLMRYTREGRNFDEAFHLATGVDYETWQIEWFEYARQKYRWGLLLEVDYLLWVVIIILAAVAVIVTFIRRRIQLKKWKDEDEDEWEPEPW